LVNYIVSEQLLPELKLGRSHGDVRAFREHYKDVTYNILGNTLIGGVLFLGIMFDCTVCVVRVIIS